MFCWSDTHANWKCSLCRTQNCFSGTCLTRRLTETKTTRDLLGTGKTPQKEIEFLALAKVFRINCTHTFSTMTSDAVRHFGGTVEGNQKLALASLRMIVSDILEPNLELEGGEHCVHPPVPLPSAVTLPLPLDH